MYIYNAVAELSWSNIEEGYHFAKTTHMSQKVDFFQSLNFFSLFLIFNFLLHLATDNMFFLKYHTKKVI